MKHQLRRKKVINRKQVLSHDVDEVIAWQSKWIVAVGGVYGTIDGNFAWLITILKLMEFLLVLGLTRYKSICTTYSVV